MPRRTGDRANLFLLRAGRRPLSAEGRFAGRLDPGLDDQGIAQARAAASALAVEEVAIVLTSPLRRARETAEVVAEASGARVRVVDELTDVDAGMWTGLSREEAAEATPEEFDLFFRFPASAAMLGGERMWSALERVSRVLESISDRGGGPVVAVTHELPIRLVLLRLRRLDGTALWDPVVAPGSITRLRATPSGLEILDSRGRPTLLARRARQCPHRAGPDAEQGASGGQRDRRRLDGGGPGDGRRRRQAPPRLAGTDRHRAPTAGSPLQRDQRRCARREPARVPGVHDRPARGPSFREALRAGAETYAALRTLLRDSGLAVGLGDEGGFAPEITEPEEALELLVAAIGAAGYDPSRDGVAIALDPAANGFRAEDGRYEVGQARLTSAEMVERYRQIVDRYPVWSIEDGLAEDDRDGWVSLTKELGDRIQLVGDDIVVTNPTLIREAIADGIGNAALIKVNQIGTVTETLEAIQMCRDGGFAQMISHRSGETTDAFIADLAVAVGCGQLKSGAPARGERVAKYNRLVEIELEVPGAPYGLAPR